jgi:hypothetical protein
LRIRASIVSEMFALRQPGQAEGRARAVPDAGPVLALVEDRGVVRIEEADLPPLVPGDERVDVAVVVQAERVRRRQQGQEPPLAGAVVGQHGQAGRVVRADVLHHFTPDRMDWTTPISSAGDFGDFMARPGTRLPRSS